MTPLDLIRLSLSAIVSQRLRSFLTALGIAVGIASVVLLTAIGEGVHRFVLSEFTDVGTNIISIKPGRTTTTGTVGGVISNVRPLTIDDAESLRRIKGIDAIVPQLQGNASVKVGNVARRTTLLGVGHEIPALWQIGVAKGRFLPPDDPSTARSFAVLGSRLAEELFDRSNPLGELIRVSGERYRVVGVMTPKGQLLGVDLDEAVYIPAARAMAMFNHEGLMEIGLLFQKDAAAEGVVDQVRATLVGRHGSEDFSITIQDDMLVTLGSILGIVTLTIGGLGGISLLVGGVGILTIMTISVSERTSEIGVLRALGSRRSQIMALFLFEAVVLSVLGGLAGLLTGIGGAWILSLAVPALPIQVSSFYAVFAVVLSILIGLIAGVAPARSAAMLDPVQALRAE